MLKVCARCEWVFHREHENGGCPMCEFAYYPNAAYVYGTIKALLYYFTEKPFYKKIETNTQRNTVT